MESIDEAARLARYMQAIVGWGSPGSEFDYESAARAAMAVADAEYLHARETYLVTLDEIKRLHAQHLAELEASR